MNILKLNPVRSTLHVNFRPGMLLTIHCRHDRSNWYEQTFQGSTTVRTCVHQSNPFEPEDISKGKKTFQCSVI